MTTTSKPMPLTEVDPFPSRHIGPSAAEQQAMLDVLGYRSLDEFIDAVVPGKIRFRGSLSTGRPRTEHDVLAELRTMVATNKVFRSFIGLGYYDTLTPPVIQRNILENPGWYTAYTPYQAEIAQGRLEALLNYQTMVMDLTGMEIANASLLDEGTAAAEAVAMAHAVKGKEGKETVVISSGCYPQTIDVVRTRAEARGWKVVVADEKGLQVGADTFAVVVQYPATDGGVHDYRELADSAHASEAMVVVATDLLALTLLAPPGEWGADVVVGNSQRFGVPLGYGGPHAAFFATKDEYKRVMPGRIIGVSRDAAGKPALRMALQTREQHIRREKATSNVCTAQVLLAVIAGMYAVWHGPEGLTRIAKRVHKLAAALAAGLERAGHKVRHDVFFDTICVEPNGKSAEDIVRAARDRSINLRADGKAVCIAFDETVTVADVTEVLAAFGVANANVDELAMETDDRFDERFARTSAFLTHPVFHSHHSETEMLRYMRTLESRDFSLVHGMIPLGSCTMKLNATAEMIPVTWTEIGKLHPFAPREQAPGYGQMFTQLESDLADITGFDAVSLQPNAGSQGEFAGLLVIRRYHESRGEGHRNVCLIPQSAHGTNPASAVMAGLEVVVVKTDPNGNIDVADLEAKARGAQGEPRGAHGDLSVHARRVRGDDHRRLLDRARQRRPGLHGRREHERARRRRSASRHRSGRLPHQPAQDVLHSARWRRSGHGSDRRREAPRAVPAGSSGGSPRRARHVRRGVGGAVGQREHPADLVGLHSHDGRRRGSRTRRRSRSSTRTTSRSGSSRTSRCCTRARTVSSRTSASSILAA